MADFSDEQIENIVKTYLDPFSSPIDIGVLDAEFPAMFADATDKIRLRGALAKALGGGDEVADTMDHLGGLEEYEADTIALLSRQRTMNILQNSLFHDDDAGRTNRPATPDMQTEFIARISDTGKGYQLDVLQLLAAGHVDDTLNQAGRNVVDMIQNDQALLAIYQADPLENAVLAQQTQYIRKNPLSTVEQFLAMKEELTNPGITAVIDTFGVSREKLEKNFEVAKISTKKRFNWGGKN